MTKHKKGGKRCKNDKMEQKQEARSRKKLDKMIKESKRFGREDEERGKGESKRNEKMRA